VSTAIRAAHHDRRLLSSTPLHLLLHVRAVLDVLPEIADVAADLVVGFEAEGDEGDEAEGEPFPVRIDQQVNMDECEEYGQQGG
jgi:hypothetical protein